MPLRGGWSRKTVSLNIAKLTRDWKRTGRVGKSRPATIQEALPQAVRIALSTARRNFTLKNPRRQFPSHLVGGAVPRGRALVR